MKPPTRGLLSSTSTPSDLGKVIGRTRAQRKSHPHDLDWGGHEAAKALHTEKFLSSVRAWSLRGALRSCLYKLHNKVTHETFVAPFNILNVWPRLSISRFSRVPFSHPDPVR